MLSKLFLLRVRSLISRNAARRGKKRGGRGMAVLLLLLFVYCAGIFGWMFYMLFSALAEALHGTPIDWFYFAFVGLMAFAISFFFSVFTAKSELFEAKDNELLLSMPISPRLILTSRLLLLLAVEYLFTLVVLIPAGLAWFFTVGVEIGTLLLFLLCGLLLPLLSVALAALVGWLLALLTARMRNQTVFTVLLTLGFLVIYFYGYSHINDALTALVANAETLAAGVRVWGALFYWFGNAIAHGDGAALLFFCAVALAAFALAVALLSRGFLRIVSGGSVKRKKRAGEKLSLHTSSLSAALLRREARRFTSSAVYLVNCGLGPLFCLAAAVLLLINQSAVAPLLAALRADGFSDGMIAALAALCISLISSIAPVTAPSVSMEGKTLWILRSSPIPAELVLRAKLTLHLLLAALPTLLLSVVCAIVLRAALFGWLILLPVPQLFLLLTGAFGLAMNLRFPKLDWVNEAAAVKQSASVAFTMLAGMFWITGGFVGIALLATGRSAGAAVFLWSYLSVSALLCIGTLLWLRKRGVRRFERI